MVSVRRVRALGLAFAPAVSGALALAAALPAHADTTGSPAPVITAAVPVKTAEGTVLSVSASDATDVSATVTLRSTVQSDAPEQVTLPLAQQADGSWRSAPLRLPYGYDWYTVAYSALDGDVPLARPFTGLVHYVKLPELTGVAVSPDAGAGAALSYGQETATVSGRLTTYDPAAGYSDEPFAGSEVWLMNSAKVWGSATAAADGSFTVTAHLPYAAAPASYTVMTPNPGADTATVSVLSHREQTRVVLDRSATAAVAGTPTTVSGQVQYLDDTDPANPVWKPLASAPLQEDLGHGVVRGPATDASGRFSVTAPAPLVAQSWTVGTATYYRNTWDTYLNSSSAAFTFTGITQKTALGFTGVSIDAHSRLTFTMSYSSTDGTPSGHPLLQVSPDGRTGWRTVATLPVYGEVTLTVPVANPHAWYRLYTPAQPGFTAAASAAAHVSRNPTRITGGLPSHTTVRRNTVVRFTGHLQYEPEAGGWKPLRGTVVLRFRAHGSSVWHTVTTARTDGYGTFALAAKVTTGGTWQVVWNTPNGSFTDSAGPATYIHLH